MPTALKYWLLQIPSAACFAVVLWWAHRSQWIEWPWAAVLMIGWIVKDALLYPLTRDAYGQTDARHGPQVGQVARVRKPLQPKGTVAMSGTLWQARLAAADQIAEPGESVRIVESKGLLLIAERCDPTAGRERS